MNKQERDYAAKRVEEIYQRKCNNLPEAKSVPSHTKQEARELLDAGKLTVEKMSVTQVWRNGEYVTDGVNVQYKLPPETKAQLEARKKSNDARKAKVDAFIVQKTEILDEIMLGDSQRALDLLKSFETSK